MDHPFTMRIMHGVTHFQKMFQSGMQGMVFIWFTKLYILFLCFTYEAFQGYAIN